MENVNDDTSFPFFQIKNATPLGLVSIDRECKLLTRFRCSDHPIKSYYSEHPPRSLASSLESFCPFLSPQM